MKFLFNATLACALCSPCLAAESPRILDARLAVDTPVKSATAQTPLVVRINLPDGPQRLLLAINTALEADARRAVPGFAASNTHLYQGTIAQHPGSWVRISQQAGLWSGALWDGKAMWTLAPAVEVAEAAKAANIAPRAHVLLKDAAWNDLDLRDDMRQPPADAVPDAPEKSPVATSATKGGLAYNLGVTLALDTEMQSFFGDESARALQVLNVVDGYYEISSNTSVFLNAMKILPAGNAGMTSTDIGTLLEQLRTYAATAAASPFHSTTYLLSGKAEIGSGLAYVDVLCNRSYATGVSPGRPSVGVAGALMAHEIGHNYGADHDGDGNACSATAFIMAPSINGNSLPTNFSSCSLTRFAARAPAFTCLQQGPPGALFANGFEN